MRLQKKCGNTQSLVKMLIAVGTLVIDISTSLKILLFINGNREIFRNTYLKARLQMKTDRTEDIFTWKYGFDSILPF
jgi:hypothetical protein